MKPNDYGEVSVLGLHVAPGSVTRMVTFVHYLIVELETRGLTIKHNERGFSAGLGPDDVRFELGEVRHGRNTFPRLPSRRGVTTTSGGESLPIVEGNGYL